MHKLATIATAFVFLVGSAVASFAEEFSTAQKTEIETLVRDYLLQHPEILREMASKLDANDKAAADKARDSVLASQAKAIFHSPMDAVVGNPKGDVTIVEFMDYNCGWCRKSVKEMQSLIASDKNVRVVMKEFPIFGEGSEYAARAALASVKQDKYWQLHQALFAFEGKVTAEVVDQVAAEQGIDVAKMKLDMKSPEIDATVKGNQAMAQTLALTGTPAFIVDTKLIPGYTELANLQALLAATRANGGCKVC
ncbi:MAG: thioredoxin domain-containing protein [Alphaproteobacteria bacterium]|nr:thioredoxin domain-containing protein [Alphaproteobacteria bacterium]